LPPVPLLCEFLILPQESVIITRIFHCTYKQENAKIKERYNLVANIMLAMYRKYALEMCAGHSNMSLCAVRCARQVKIVITVLIAMQLDSVITVEDQK
jgi:hypothetical protein